MKKQPKEYSVPAIDKTVAILNALADRQLSIQDIHTSLNVPKSTAFVILNALEQYSLIQKNPEGKYRLGHGVLRWGIGYMKSMDLVTIARPHLEKLIADTPYTAHLAVSEKDKPVYVDKVEGNGFVRFATNIGQIQPLHMSGVGKAIASGMSDEEIASALTAELEAAPDKLGRAMEKLMEDVRYVRKYGYSIEDEEFEEGIRCIGAPIRDGNGQVFASISITSLNKDLPATKFQQIGEAVKETADRISAELGFMEQQTMPKGELPKHGNGRT
ncbi:IclR family transcriptional regulator [Paenibacillus mesophilus]|uniref:IclR family transcriptional regulator n=1 Tax=Paenibacillus mesophilus TaxID=2582849 RepID=UPI00110EE424|nr:IclR family transcriptional regulator [Paenibacillus mesophilus]TMV45549.1 IclR family transcriptional regulator [Paenibacillus mesophilus]